MVKSGGGAKARPRRRDKTPEKPRLDYVFIMGETPGEEGNPFYREAGNISSDPLSASGS